MSNTSDKDTLLTNPAFEEFCLTVQSIIQTVSEITDLERDKAAAAAQRQHHLLDGYINQEQAAMLKLRGFEKKRSQYMEQLGFGQLTFRQILETVSPQEFEQLSPLFTELMEGLKVLTDTKTDTDRLIRSKLRELDLFLSAKNGASYGPDGKHDLDASGHRKDTYI